MEVTIEKATSDNLKEIQELNLALFEKEQKEYDPTFNLDWTFGKSGTKYFKESIEDKDACALVAKADGQVVGYLIGWIKKKMGSYRTIKKQAELENMFVFEEFRSQKIGKKLTEQFFKWTKDKSVDNVCVTASAENNKAIEFYRRVGFKDYDHTLEINL